MFADRAEATLKELGEPNDIIKAMHRALNEHRVADERGAGQYVTHRLTVTEPIVGRVLAKELAGDEMSDRLHVTIDGVDGRTHYVEAADAAKLVGVEQGHIIALDPIQAAVKPRRPLAAVAHAADPHNRRADPKFEPRRPLARRHSRLGRFNHPVTQILTVRSCHLPIRRRSGKNTSLAHPMGIPQAQWNPTRVRKF